MNDHSNYRNRAIRNAKVEAMVHLSSEDADRANIYRKTSSLQFREYVAVSASTTQRESSSSRGTAQSMPSTRTTTTTTDGESTQRRTVDSVLQGPHFVQETDSGTSTEGRVYYPLSLEPAEHPYFEKIWYVRHKLDARSPLLKASVREQLKRRGGVWTGDIPRQTLTHQDIMKSLVDFHRIRITFNGTASSNSLIFAMKVYYNEDVYIGWQFVDLFYEKVGWLFRNKPKDEDSDERHMLDKRLINDIIPQPGGGQEPLE